MSKNKEFLIEKYEEYYGSVSQVLKIIEDCSLCGSKLILTHIGHMNDLFLEEKANCPDCGHKKIKTIHSLN